ncbi:hypothetical protein [Sphingomonas sp.]|uniref:hypothetical protein n=1 Tax=Sphingomonas sp. TaxID=28214 RepID=UPI00286DDC35|nr:hypothetical protein [Sphingomonas sp.]
MTAAAPTDPPANPRAGRTMTARELARFLGHLAATGNFALACARAGRARSGLFKRRARDPAFNAECERALTAFRLNSPTPSGQGSSAQRDGVWESSDALLTAPGEIILSHGRKRPPQFRRAAPGQLTQAGIATFLRALAATANVRLAAASVGVAHSSIYARRRRRDPAFAAAMRSALLLGYDLVESALLEAAGRAFDDGGEWHGEGNGEPGDEAADGSERVAARPAIDDRISVDQALQLLRLHRRTARAGWDSARHQVEVATPAEVVTALKRRLKQLGWDQ